MYIPQQQLKNIDRLLSPRKAVIIYGARRCGKTTLIKKYLESITEKYLFVSGEDITARDYLSSQSIEKLRRFLGRNKILVVDEAQKIPEIGLNFKLILDHIEGIRIIATGSSSFDLAQDVGEPLTGRKFTLKLYPLSQVELAQFNRYEALSSIEERLIFGSYPEVVLNKDDKIRRLLLREIVDSYLYKDIMELDKVRNSAKISQLLQLLAFQIGKEVSFTEIGKKLGMSKNTVERYLDLLEKTFVIFRLNGFSRNLRKEITKNSRFYFYDVGIRNALINNFNPLSIRNDTGLLWENFIITEMLKKQEYHLDYSLNYFWRTYDQNEIDLIQEKDGILHAYEIKYSPAKKASSPLSWRKAYPDSKCFIINRENFMEFLMD